MKFTVVFLVFVSLHFAVLAQLTPVANSYDDYKQHKVRLVRTIYQPEANSMFDKEHTIFEKEFNQNGQLVKTYQLFLWEAVSYSYTTTYHYSEAGQLIEEQKDQEILSLLKRDEDFVKIFGNKPLNQRILYYYNAEGLLSRKDLFNYEDEFIDTLISQSVIYKYENGLKMKEQSSSPDEKVFNRNYQIVYQYDSSGNLLYKTRAFGEDQSLARTTSYVYNKEDQLIEEKTVDEAFPHNNSHFKYSYNSEGLLYQKFEYDAELEGFDLLTTYEYDSRGQAIKGDRNVQFEYDSRGLVVSESWTEPISEEKITFITSYDFF